MKRLSIFFAALMACTLSFAQTTVTKTVDELVTANKWTVSEGTTATCYKNFSLDDNVTVSTSGEDNCGSVWGESNRQWRLYQNKEGDITIAVSGGYTISSVTLTYAVSNDGVLQNGTTKCESGTAISVNAKSITLTVGCTGTKNKGQVRITQFSVTYAAEGGTTEPVSVESVALDKAELSIAAGKTATLVATITPANATNKAITWATDNDKVATVADGVVTAVAEGTANITVTTADGAKTATCAVTVTAASQAVDVTIYSVDFTKAAEAKTWTIDDKEKAGLDYVWQQTTKYGMKASAFVSGKNNATESWLISPAIDFSRAESATMTFSHARNFGSNDHLSVKVTTDGGSTWNDLTVSAWPKGGWDFIEATADLTKLLGSASAKIAFVYTSTSSSAATWEIKNLTITGTETYVPATGITLNTAALTMQKYKYISLIATVTPATTTDAVVWKSDNEEVATVSEKGVVTAVATGTANITATAGKYSATCAITVEEATFITCAQAVELAKAVSGNNVAAEGGMYVIRGYVTAYEGTPADDMKTYKNYSAWLADTKGGEGIFLAFQVKPVDGTTVAAVGDFVEVVGDITQYTKDDNTKYETMGKGTATINILIPAPKVYAVMAEYDATMGSVACGEETDFEIGEYEKNTEITLTATPKDGYKFMNWTVNVGEDENTETANPLTITVTADMTITANFVKNVSTAIDDINADGVVVEKVIRNGQVLIIRDGKTYNVIGKMID